MTRRFGRYRLLERLGEGGMAAVWRARVEGPEGFVREVVLKRVLAEHSRDEEFVRALVHEARLSALLNHPGIVQVHELGFEEGEHYLAMEYIDGCSLATLLGKTAAAGQPLPIGVVCHVVAELAGALAYAHELADADGVPLGIVHRDISPSNVMIERSGAVKLVDFGIAQAVSRLRDERTRTGVLKGKLGYLAPEQIDGATADRRTDLFALGVVFYECLTDQRLFGGGLKALAMVRSAELLPPSVQRPEIPPDVDRIALKLLARDPALRHPRGDELQEELLAIVHRLEGDGAALARVAAGLGAFAAPSRPPIVGDEPEAEATSIRLDERDMVREGTMALGDAELAAMRAAVPKERTIALGEADLMALAPKAKKELTTLGLDTLATRDKKVEAAGPHPLDAVGKPASERGTNARVAIARIGGERTREPTSERKREPSGGRTREPSGERKREPSGERKREPSGERTRERTDSTRRERTRTGRTAVVRPLPRAHERAARQVQLMAAFGVGAVVAVALPLWLLRGRAAPPPATPPAIAAAPPAIAPPPIAAPPRAADVRLIVDGEPGARLVVDGVERGRLPVSLTLPAQPGVRTLEIDEPGRVRAMRQVRGDVDAQLDVELQPLPAAPSHASARTPAAAAKSPAAPAPSAHKSAGEIESPF